jgi:hypothetical protein
MRPSEVSQALEALLPTRQPLYLWGPPGVGKSSVVRQAAEKAGLELLDLRAVLLERSGHTEPGHEVPPASPSPGRQRPQANGRVATGAGCITSVWRGDDGSDAIANRLECIQLSPRRHVPQPDAPVQAS